MAQLIAASDLSVYPSLAGQPNLADLATEADGALRSHLRRKVLASESLTETFRLRLATDRLVCSDWPITAISSITVAGVTVAGAGYEIEDQFTILRLGSVWPPDTKIVVSYTAGYISGSRDYLVLKRAAAWIALASVRGAADPTDETFGLGQIRRLKLGDYEVESAAGVSQAGDAVRFPDDIERMLKPYYRRPQVS